MKSSRNCSAVSSFSERLPSFLSGQPSWPTMRNDVLRVTEEVYESQAFILGKKVEAFEKDFAAYCSAKYAVGVSSGTDALLVANEAGWVDLLR